MRYLAVLAAASAALTLLTGAGPTQITISQADLRDKIEGGWAGQMIGVSFGAPTEFGSNAKINTADLPKWTPERVSNSLDQDDLYVDMTFAKVIDDKGLDATIDDFAEMFRDAKYRLWHANLAARRNLKRGVKPALAGTPKYNAHANDIDFQIEADFVGLMCPGLPQSANVICERAGRLMNSGDGLYGGMFISGMYASAFLEKDARKVVQAGLASIPPKSPYAQIVSDVLQWSSQYPNDWQKVWQLIEDKWDKREPCPEGALRPFNIDAKLNGAYVAMALLYGKGDFGKTIEIATRAGQDSDCNPASAAGILGVMIGYKGIPEEWKGGIPALADRKFNYTEFSFHSIVSSTYLHALELISRNSGKKEGENLILKVQQVKPPKLEVWDNYGSPAERVTWKEKRWTFQGQWTGTGRFRSAKERGAEARIDFEGTGAIVVGPYLPTGGKADIYLDGKLDRTVDVYPDEDSIKHSEAVWHAFNLKNGRHTIRLVVRGETYGKSKGTDIGIEDLIVFRP